MKLFLQTGIRYNYSKDSDDQQKKYNQISGKYADGQIVSFAAMRYNDGDK